MSSLVAVIDIGKTNKKVALIDEALAAVASRSARFPAQMQGGLLCEPVDAIWTWLTAQLRDLYRERPFQAIVVSTHGGCWAALDERGELSVPVIAYEHDLGEDGQRDLDLDFYRRCGPLAELQDETGTCDLPLLINPAKAILFAQRLLPQRWSRSARILDYPQYWGWRLTGAYASEATYAANHSFLLDIRRRQPSRAARALGVDRLIDVAFKRPWDELGRVRTDLARELDLPPLPVAVGIHDSNAALLPYLVKHAARDFVVDSTGTWCVAMHRVLEVRYRADEIGQKVIFNIDALGGLEKVSFLMGGQDYALYHGLAGGDDPGFDLTRLDQALADPTRAILPGAFPSQFPACRGGLYDAGRTVALADLRAGRAPPWFRAELAHDLLNVSLALQSEVALRRTGITEATTIFVEGVFRANATFLAVLAALFPNNTVACTSLPAATVCGAALVGHALLARRDPTSLADRIAIGEEPVRPPRLAHLAAYRERWLAAVQG